VSEIKDYKTRIIQKSLEGKKPKVTKTG